MEIRCLKGESNFYWDEGFTYRDVFLVEQPDGYYFLYLKKNGKQVSFGSMGTTWCFFDRDIYVPPAFEIRRYKKLLKKENDMDTKERIAKLEAELAELKKEEEFKPYLAWVSDENANPRNTERLALIISYSGESYPFRDNEYNYWYSATPLTRAEVLAYLPPVKSKYDWDAILKVYPNAQVAARHPNGDIVIGSQSKIKVGSVGFSSVTQDGGFLFGGDNYRWVLDKDCDWRDSIEYRRDAV